MASVDTLMSEFSAFEADWADVRPYLLQYLHNDGRTGEADRLFSAAGRYLGWATRAEERRQRRIAMLWYALALARMREHNRLVEELGERGLQAQEEAKKRRNART